MQLLSTEAQEYAIRFLTNAPNGDDSILYSNYIGQITAIVGDQWEMNINPISFPVADYLDLTGINTDTAFMTEQIINSKTDIPIFTLVENTWTQVEQTSVEVGDILLFASDDQGNLIWSVLLQNNTQEPDNSDTPDMPTEPETPTDPTTPGGSDAPSRPSGNGGYPGGANGGYPSGGTAKPEQQFELYSLNMVQIASVTPQGTMTLDITIDELDIRALQVGMSAQVKIDAMGGMKHIPTITQIGNTGTGNGGNSKYTVELTMERIEDMLAGMNASATIVLSTKNDVLTIPVDALVENGNQTVVYTGYDEKRDMLLQPVVVQVGNSDGETAEILDGLTDGQAYYYAYYDTLEVSFTPDFGSSWSRGNSR